MCIYAMITAGISWGDVLSNQEPPKLVHRLLGKEQKIATTLHNAGESLL
jgi:hypothetical protein